MLFRTSSGGLATLALVLSAIPSGAALGAASSPVAAVSRPAQAKDLDRSAHAREILSAVRAEFAGQRPGSANRSGGGRKDGRDLTLLLAELHGRLSDLSASDRKVARAYLARPTDGSNDYYGTGYASNARPTSDCKVRPTKGSHVCIHWARKTSDAPPLKDSDNDGLPNQVEKTRNVLNRVWQLTVDQGKFHRPLKDTRGPNGRLDIYLMDLGQQGLYGYCAPEKRISGRAATGYCVLDDDYSRVQFPAHTPKQTLAVTAAHEFFHAVQFAYDYREDPWFMEGSAAWIEDELYDGVNDNYQYLAYSQLQDPRSPLDDDAGGDGMNVYGSWIWWRYLTERFPYQAGTGLPRIMLELWRRADNSGRTYKAYPSKQYSLQAVSFALGDRGTDMPTMYSDFVLANRRVEASYSEGAAYPNAPVEGSLNLTTTTPSSGSVTLDHLTSATYVINPGGALTELAVEVDLPDSTYSPRARATVFFTDNSTQVFDISFDGTGAGTVSGIPFDASVDHVELALLNGARKADALPFAFTLTGS